MPLKRVARIIAGQSPPSDLVSDFNGEQLPFLQGNAEFGTVHPAPRRQCDAAPKRAKPGDILLSVKAPVGALNTADRHYGIGRGLCAIRVGSELEPRFAWWMAVATTPQLAAVATGSTYDAVTADDVGTLKVPVPRWTTQRAIASFLDAEIARIDELVDARTRQRGLVAERLSTVLDVAFSSAPGRMRIRLKRVLRSSPCYGVLVPRFDSDGVPFIRVGDLTRLASDGTGLARIDRAQSREYSRTVVAGGDILVSVVGSVDKCAVVPSHLAGANVARAVARLRPISEVPSDLVTSWMSTPSYLAQAALATGSGTAQPTLNMGDLANFQLHLPDTRRGIEALADELRERRAIAGQVTAAVDHQIALLRERRQALITAAVTGRLQVPDTTMANAAA